MGALFFFCLPKSPLVLFSGQIRRPSSPAPKMESLAEAAIDL